MADLSAPLLPLAAELPAAIALSVFRQAADNRPTSWTGTWEEWASELVSHGHLESPEDGKTAKAACPMVSPAVFSSGKHESAVQGVSCAFLDYDHCTPEDLAQAVATALGHGWAALAYTAWSHGPVSTGTFNTSARLVLPLSRSVPRQEWPGFWARLQALLGGRADPQCKDASRAYFLPATHVSRAPHAWIRQWGGLAVSVDAVLAQPFDAVAVVEAVGHGTQRIASEELKWLATRLRQKEPGLSLALLRVLGGEPFAEHGDRDNVLYRLAGELARAFPDADPSYLAQHFTASVSRWDDISIQDVQDKIARRLTERAAEKALKEHAAVESARAKIAEATAGARTAPYTTAEIEVEGQPGLATRWVLQKAKAFWFYVLGSGYVGPFTADEATRAAHTYLAPATGVGVRLTELTDAGRTRHRTIQELVQDYGQIAVHVTYDMNAQKAAWDVKTATLTVAPSPRRVIAPAFHPEVDLWLRMLGGEAYPYLEQWIAYSTRIDKPCVALFLEGPPHAGKGLLAQGLSRLWTTSGPSPMTELFSAFNAGVMHCPLVFADETMPRQLRGRTAELREIIQSTQRQLNAKFMPLATLAGAFRVLIAANNRNVLEGEDVLTQADIAAIAGRILHVVVPGNETDWVAFFKAHPSTDWVYGDKIAGHALYLAGHVEVPANAPRFLIEPPRAELTRTIATSSTAGSAVAHWLVSFLLNPGKVTAGKPMSDSSWTVCVKADETGQKALYAGTRALVEYWDTYTTNLPREKATVRTIARGLEAISDGQHRIAVARALRPRAFRVRSADLITWAENTGMATREEIEAGLARETPSPEKRAN